MRLRQNLKPLRKSAGSSRNSSFSGLTINELPDDVILMVFSFLSPKYLAQAGGTCPRWYNLSNHPILWKDVYFIASDRLALRQLAMFASSRVAQLVESLTLEGYIIRSSSTAQKSTNVLSKPVLEKISRNLVNLTSLRVENANISNVNLSMFPRRLEHLSIYSCIIDEKFASSENSNKNRFCSRFFRNLKSLDFAYVHKLDGKLSDSIRNFTWLEELDVTHCVRLTKKELLIWAKNMQNLRILNISELRIVDDEVFLAFARLRRLMQFYVSYTKITNFAIEKMCKSDNRPKFLRVFDIRGCVNVTGEVVAILRKYLSLDQLFIHRNMLGFCEARNSPLLSPHDTNFEILDEIDTGSVVLPYFLERIQQIRDLNFY
ncbi:unnamed protein product [Caenorhabditis angaria]|uniref:F-box domain-containing protein n=1 Tax=Caenorhabditis angaria TaxID=860376 RepID=A0A9P1MYJ6_9PELO|nr:unnamed protein product [Caenorhabditis angaria]